MEGKSVLDYLLRDLVRVEDVKLSRAAGRSDTRKGLVLTPAGKAAIQKDSEIAGNSPQSPQSPQSVPQVQLPDNPLNAV